ncbi:MAG: hypothetical protein KDA24_09445 [Deltaproteobacteria bacterium]|nr:hypothetical protein [Deltaproteobacteria bacterium]
MQTTRRRFLKYGLGGVLLLAVPAVGLSLRRSVLVEPKSALLTFSPRQYSTLTAMADTLCPGGGKLPSASDLDIAGTLDMLFSRMHPGVGADLAAALDLLENALAGAVLDQRFQTFTACDADVRDEVLRDWSTSAITLRRAVYKALRGFIMAAYWGNAATWGAIGYPGIADYSAVPSPPPFDEYIAALTPEPERGADDEPDSEPQEASP